MGWGMLAGRCMDMATYEPWEGIDIFEPEKDFPSLRQFNVTYIFYLGFYRSDVLDLHIF